MIVVRPFIQNGRDNFVLKVLYVYNSIVKCLDGYENVRLNCNARFGRPEPIIRSVKRNILFKHLKKKKIHRKF